MKADAIAQCRMTLLRPKPGRRRWYVAKWLDPTTGRWKQQPLDTKIKSMAKTKMGELAERVVTGVSTGPMNWADFCDRYERQKLSRTGESNLESWNITKRWLGKYWNPKTLQEVAREEAVEQWRLRVQDERSLAEASMACYLARLRAALKWAEARRLIVKAPKIHVGKIRSRGGAISRTELEALCKAAQKVRPRDACHIQRFIRGLFWSGFRLDELRTLSWDRGSQRWLDASGQIPVVWFSQTGQKSRRVGSRYILTEFWELCAESPVRTGYVFALPTRHGQMAAKTISRIISDIGEEAGIVTDPDQEKTCTAQDLRKSCSAVLHEKGYSLDETALFLGHESPETTRAHYPPTSAAALAAKEWALKIGGER